MLVTVIEDKFWMLATNFRYKQCIGFLLKTNFHASNRHSHKFSLRSKVISTKNDQKYWNSLHFDLTKDNQESGFQIQILE